MGKAISATQKISSTLKGLVVLVHHSGKDRSKGLRGHSSMLAAVDTAIRVDEKNQHRQWKAMKVKDAESGSIEIFDLLGCGIGMDVEGQPETSCAVGRIDVELVPSSAEFLPTGKNQQLVYVALKNGLQGDKVINEGVGLKLAKDALPGTRSKHLANRAREALVGLVSGGYIIMSGGVYSLPTTPGLGPNPTP
jgi:hypothetical protein